MDSRAPELPCRSLGLAFFCLGLPSHFLPGTQSPCLLLSPPPRPLPRGPLELPVGEGAAARIGWFSLSRPLLPPAELALSGGVGEASIALWWRLLGPHVMCLVALQLNYGILKATIPPFVGPVLRQVSKRWAGGEGKGAGWGRRRDPVCGAQSSAKPAGLTRVLGVLVSAVAITVKECSWFQWELIGHGPRGARQPPFITHVCSAPSEEPSTWRGALLCVDTAASGFAGRERLRCRGSLQRSGGPPPHPVATPGGETWLCRAPADTLSVTVAFPEPGLPSSMAETLGE